MTDLELLFLVLGIIYFWECGWWAKCGSVGFRTWLGQRWRVAFPSRLLGNQHGGLIFAPPLPPLGTLLSSHCFPLSISTDGVLAFVPPAIESTRRVAQSGRFFAFTDIRSIEAAGKKLRINGDLFLRAGSPTYAHYLAELLRRLQTLSPTERKQAIEKEVESLFEAKQLKQVWKEFLTEARGLRVNANGLFLYLFGIVPLILWRFGLSLTWPWLVAGLLACTLTIAVQFNRTHKRRFPGEEDERFTHFIILLLSPASAVRARDLLTRPLLEKFHPLVPAQVFCSPESFEQQARQFLRELRFPALPLCPRPEPVAQATERYARELQLRVLEDFLRRSGYAPDKLLQPPSRSDPGSQSYCPRCHTQFTILDASCQDCGGIRVVPFESQAKGGRSQRESTRPVLPSHRPD